ncbi:MAG: hypothetical protein IKM82_04160 [Oscillospiraceae bacterium]|nr:hypothetical protein [Oscillospiraceae bacterium]
MLKKWKAIAPLALTAAGALASGVAILMRKLPKDTAPAAESAPAAKPANLKTGSYSFISGFEDAETVELSMDFDPEKFSFAIVEDEFLNYSSDSHVAIVYGEEFNLQLEYACYYNGEDFAAHSAALKEKYQTRGEITCGVLTGLWVLDGDNIAIHFPIPDDKHSYLLVTVQKTPDYDDEITTLPDYAPLKALLATVRFARS